VVGVDQTREAPALWILWVEGAGAERVVMSHRELAALAAGCTGAGTPVAGTPAAPLKGGRARSLGSGVSPDNEKKTAKPSIGPEEAAGGVPRRRASGDRGGD